MVNNSSCIVFGCSKKGIWSKIKSDAGERTAETAHEVAETSENVKCRSFYRFPAINPKAGQVKQELQRTRRKKWLVAVKRENISEIQLKHLRICDRHFISGKPANLCDVDNPDWIPGLNLGYKKNGSQKLESKVARFERKLERERIKKVTAEQMMALEDNMESGDSNDMETFTGGCGTQTDLTYPNIAEMELELHRREEKIFSLEQKIRFLEQRIAHLSLQEEAFMNEDKKVCHFTGLQSYALLMLILKYMTDALNSFRIGRLNNFQKLMLVLMKLRLNVSYTTLGYRFEIRTQQASKCFKKVVVLLEYTFSALVHWPDRESLRTAMPESFLKAFGNSVAVIVDCFEIGCQKPSNLKAKSQSYSQYKHNYTAQYLIGITPQGTVSFISNGYGGRASDNFITQDSGLLDHLQFGDVVLADRGFTIKEEFSMLYAELMTPDFLQGKKQLPPAAIERTRKIASVRIHVERVIGLVRTKFRILKGPVPINFLKEKHANKCFLDYVVRVSCILTNMCNSVVPMEKPKHVNDNVTVALTPELFTRNFDFCT